MNGERIKGWGIAAIIAVGLAVAFNVFIAGYDVDAADVTYSSRVGPGFGITPKWSDHGDYHAQVVEPYCKPAYSAMNGSDASGVNSDVNLVFLDRDDTKGSFPHTGDTTSFFKIKTIEGNICNIGGRKHTRFQFGVVTRIDATNADIHFFHSGEVVGGSVCAPIRYNFNNCIVDSTLSGGTVVNFRSGYKSTNDTDFQTDTFVFVSTGAGATVKPAYGDIVGKFVEVDDAGAATYFGRVDYYFE